MAHEETNDLGDLTEAFERLQKSKEVSDLPQRQQGRRAGIEWAKLKATYEELRLLRKFVFDIECDLEDLIYREGSECIGRAIDWDAMWEDLADGEDLTVPWQVGFCEGANDVFDEFATRLQSTQHA